MKLFKRLTAFLIATVLSIEVTPVFAEYYVQRDFPTVTALDFEYRKVSLDQLAQHVEKIKKLVKSNGKEESIYKLLYQCYEIYYATHNAYSVANLAADRFYNKTSSDNLKESLKINVEALNKTNEAILLVYNSKYKDLLTQFFGEQISEFYIYNIPTAKAIELSNREQELINQYTDIYGDNHACAELFAELVSVRNELAKEWGFENYAQYANAVIYGRDFSQEQLDEFYEGVIEYIIPMQLKFAKAMSDMDDKYVPMTDDDILLNTRMIMGYINPELRKSFDYMISNNLYDVFATENKSSSSHAYTINIPSLSVPFLFVNPEDGYNKDGVPLIKTLIHEFGHFSAMLNDQATSIPYYDLNYICSIETSETQSQGLEVLSEKYYGRMFGSAAAYERYSQAYSILISIIDGCLFNEWQTAVYENDKITVDELNDIAVRTINKYYNISYHPEDAMEIWTSLIHNYTLPMYYISYAISGMAALDLYNTSVRNFDDAVDKYMAISSCGGYMPFNYLIELGVISDVFDKDEIHRLSVDLMRNYGLNYTDVDENGWYMPYICDVSNIFFGRAENTFMPDTDITRSEFVGAIGRMYDYYVGIKKEYTQPFADVGQGDENSRYIAWAQAEGIVSGYDNDTFGGNDALSREQAAAIIYRLQNTQNVKADYNDEAFADFSLVSDWAKMPVIWAARENIIDGRDNNLFEPKSNISRAETSKIISCYIKNEY